MKFLLLFLTLAPLLVFAQKKDVTIKAGTIVPMEAIKNVRAADVHEGSNVDFRVTKDIIVDNVVAIPAGTIAKGTVYEATKSSLAGTKGRLGIRVRNLIVPSGDQIFFTSSDVYITGKNRTPLAVITALFVWPCIFIPGTRAEMYVGYEFDATIGSNTTLTTE